MYNLVLLLLSLNDDLNNDSVYLLFSSKVNVIRGRMYNASNSINDGFEFKKTVGSVFFFKGPINEGSAFPQVRAWSNSGL